MDTSNDDLSVGVSFDADTRPITTALAEIKATLKALDQALPKGQIERALAEPIAKAVKSIDNSVNGMRESFRKAQGAMVDEARRSGKEMGAAFAGGMEQAAMTVKRQMAQMQAQYEGAVANGWKINVATLQKLREEGVRLYAEDRRRLLDAGALKKLETDAGKVGEARLKAERQFLRASERETQATYNALYRFKVSEAKKAAAEESSFLKSVQRDTQSTYNAIYKAKVAEAKKAAAEERTFLSAVQRDTQASYNAIYRFKAAEAKKAAADESSFLKSVQRDTQSTYNAMYRFKVSEAKKAAAEESSFLKSVQRDTQSTYNAIYRAKVAEAKKAAAEEASFAKTVARETQATYNAMYRQKVREAAAAQRQIELLETTRARNQVRAATWTPEGAYSSLRTGQVVDPAGVAQARALAQANKEVSDRSKEAARAQEELKKTLGLTTKSMNDAHSAARGLASGFNAMWLTWGNIAPLLAGAAVSTSFVQSLKIGAEVGQNLTKIYALGGESAEAVSALNAELLRMSSKGPFGPIEVSNALKTLSLAGLDAKQQIDALQSVLNFAVAGDLPIEKAAETLVAVGTAYGYTAKNFDVVSDLISQAAASSMSSVENMSEAFKQASVIAQQYRVSLQDTALSLSMLAQIGIQGSAAGTAVRNMYTELLGSSQKARKVLQDTLKIDVWDKQANAMKPVIQIMKEMNEALSKFESRDQQKILNALGNERGTKAIAANLAGLRAEWGNTQEEFNNGLAKMQRQLEDAPGFAAIAAVKMAQSTQNQIKSVFSALQTELVKAFQSTEPEVQKLAMSLKALFQSDEFQTTLSGLVSGVASLLNALVSLTPVLEVVAKAYISLKVAQLAAAAVMVATSAWATATTAITAMTTALGAGVGGLTALRTAFMAIPAVTAAAAAGFTTLQISMGAIGLVLAGLTTAYFLFRKSTKESDDARNAANVNLDSTLDGLKKEEERLQKMIEARRAGVAEMEIEGKVRAEQIKAEIAQRRDLTLAKLQEARATMLTTQANLDPDGNGGKDQNGRVLHRRAEALKNLKAELQKNLNEIADVVVGAEEQIARVDNVQRLARENARQAREEAEKNRRTPTGPLTFDEDALSKKSRARVESLKTDLGNELSLIKQRYTDEVSTIQQAERNEQELLKQRREAKLVTDGEFYARELQLAQESETKRLQLIESAGNEWGAKFVSQWESLHQNYARVVDDINSKLKGDDARQALGQAAEAMQQKLTQMAAEAQTFYQTLNNDEKTVKDNIFTRTQLQAIKAQGAIRAVQLEMEKFRREQKAASEAANRAEAFEDQVRYASPEQVAYMQAANTEKERFIELLVEEAEAQRQAELDLAAYLKTAGDMSTWGKEQFQLIEGLMNLIEELKRKQIDLSSAGVAAADGAGMRALRRYQKDEIKRLSGDTAEALITGLRKGSKEGGKQLRKIIEAELRKPIVMAVQAVVQPVVGALMGSLGFGGGGGGVAGSALSSIGSSIGGSMIGNTVMSSIGSIGGVVGTAYNTALGTSLGLGSSSAAAAAKAASMAGGTSAASASLGSMLGAAMPWIAGAGAIYSIAKSFDNSGTPHMGAGAIYKDGRLREGKDLYGSGAFNMGHRDEYNANSQANVSGIASVVGGALDALATSFGKKAGYEVATAFADDSSKDGAWGALRISKDGQELLNWQNTRTSRWAPKEFGDGEEGYKQYLAAVAKDTRQLLLDMDLPGWADNVLQAIGDSPSIESLSTALTQIGEIQTVFVALGKALKGFSTLTDEAQETLLSASGGAQALAQNATAFYQGYYSERERISRDTAELTESFKTLGFTLPRSREELRALIEAQVALGDAGAETAGKLLTLSGAFANVSSATEAAQRAFTENLINLESRFKDGGLSRRHQVWSLVPQLSALLSGTSLQESDRALAERMLTSTSDDIEAYFRKVWEVLPNDDARAKLMEVTDAMLSLSEASEEAAKNLADAAIEFAQATARTTEEARYITALGAVGNRSALQELGMPGVGQTAAMRDDQSTLQSLSNVIVVPAVQAPVIDVVKQAQAAATEQYNTLAKQIANTPGIEASLQVGGWLPQWRDAIPYPNRETYGIPAFADGGYHFGGARLVGERGREIEVTGPSMILSNPITEAILGRSDNDGAVSAAVVAELRGLRADVDNLRYEVRAVATNTGDAANTLRRASPGRDSFQVTLIADETTPVETP